MPESTPTTAPSPPRRRRRVWRWVLSLRGLMVLVLIIGGGLGWWVRQVRIRRDAIALIEAAGSTVLYDDEQFGEVGWQTWVYQRMGLEMFREVWGVEIEDETQEKRPPGTPAPPARAEVCAAAGRLGRVEAVSFYEGTVTPANLAELRRAGLHRLDLEGIAAVSDALLAEIGQIRSLLELGIDTPAGKVPVAALRTAAALPDLEELTLNGLAPATAADLAPLGRLAHLTALRIDPAPVDPAYLDDLQTLPSLSVLKLPQTQVTDAQLRRLVAALPHLTDIDLDGSRLTDAGIKALAALPDLETLDLNGSGTGTGQVSDASLQALGGCRQLGSLTLTHGRFTAAGIDALQGLPLWALDLGVIESIHPTSLARPATGQPWALLGLHGPGINDAAMPGLAAVVGPRTHLDLSGSALTDAGAVTLAPAPLRILWLSNTALTDAGLAALAQSTTARRIYVAGTQVTPAGVAAFRAARPRTTLNSGSIRDER